MIHVLPLRNRLTKPTLPPSTFSNPFSSSMILAVICDLSRPALAYERDWRRETAPIRAVRNGATWAVEKDRRADEREADRRAAVNIFVALWRV